MAKFTFEGMEEYERKLSRLGSQSTAAAKKAVYAGAGLVAKEIKSQLQSLQTTPDKKALAAYQKKEAIRITSTQKQGLLNGFGLAKMRNENGYISTKAGFDGYNAVKSKRWPQGQPNAMIARSCERGSTAMLRQPFVSKAVSRAKKQAEDVMGRVIDEECEKIMK